MGGITLTAGAELFGYSAGYEGSTQVTEKLSQRDIHLKLGVGIPFGGGGIGMLSPDPERPRVS